MRNLLESGWKGDYDAVETGAGAINLGNTGQAGTDCLRAVFSGACRRLFWVGHRLEKDLLELLSFFALPKRDAAGIWGRTLARADPSFFMSAAFQLRTWLYRKENKPQTP